MSKRVVLFSSLAVLAVVGIAAVVAQADPDPTESGRKDEFAAVGSVMPSGQGVHATPIEAAAAFASELDADGKPIPADAEVIVIPTSDASADDETAMEKEVAVRVDGVTVAVLDVSPEAGGWTVQGFVAC